MRSASESPSKRGKSANFLGAVCNFPPLGKSPHNLGYISTISPSEISEGSRSFQNLLLNLLILCRLFFCLVRRDAQDPLIPLHAGGYMRLTHAAHGSHAQRKHAHADPMCSLEHGVCSKNASLHLTPPHRVEYRNSEICAAIWVFLPRPPL